MCGSDNETYANECVMKAEACMLKKTITIRQRGECIEKEGNIHHEYDSITIV